MTPSVRAVVTQMEDLSEAVAEGERTGRDAQSDIHTIARAWERARPGLASAGTSVGEQAALNHAVAALARASQPLAVQRAANDVTGALVPFFQIVGEGIPGAVHRLDYLGRSLTLDAKTANWERARADESDMNATWQRLEPQVLARRGATEAATFAKALRQIDLAVGEKNATKTESAARVSGDSVDGLEKLYPAR